MHSRATFAAIILLPCPSGGTDRRSGLIQVFCFDSNGGPGQVRTGDLEFRKLSLYPSELQALTKILILALYPSLYPKLYPTQALSGTKTSGFARCPSAKSLILRGGSQ